MSDILSNAEIAIYDPGNIKKDVGVTLTYIDSRGRTRSVNSISTTGENFQNVLGPKYLEKFAGTLWEGAWKTAASFMPAGKGLIQGITYTAAKIATKTVGTAGNYIVTGQYGTVKALTKATIINGATLTNFAPLLTSSTIKNTVVGKTFGSYYTALSGDGHSESLLKKYRLGYVNIGSKHLHGSIYPLNPLLQAEVKATGYNFYKILSGEHPWQLAYQNKTHINDNEHNANVENTHNQAADGHATAESHAQAEPKSGGGHDEGEYQGAFLPWSVERSRAASNWVKEGYENSYKLEAGIATETALWKNKVSKADGVIDTIVEFTKGVPNQVINNQLLGLVYFNRYITRPVTDIVVEGFAETVEAIDKSIEAVADYTLAAGHIAAAKLDDFFRTPSFKGAKNPFEEIVVITDTRGKKTTTYVAKARTDNAKIVKPVNPKLLIDMRKEQKEADDALKKLVGFNKQRIDMNIKGEDQRAAQGAIYGAAGKPNNFVGYKGLGTPTPLVIGGVRTQQNAANRATMNGLFGKTK